MFDIDDMRIEATETPTTHLNGLEVPSVRDCMSCGICVEQCPTFRLTANPMETPRHRLRILEKYLTEQPVTTEERQQLDNCLQCYACEPICPSRMPYRQLFNAVRAGLSKQDPLSLLTRLGLALVTHKRLRFLLLPWLKIYLHSGLQKTLRASGLLEKLGLQAAEQLAIQPSLSGLSGIYRVKQGKTRGRVALFTGCLAEHFDQQTLKAAIKVLNVIGYEVVIPEAQVCCGALHQHLGQNPQQFINRNLTVFYALEVQAILTTATGCAAMLSSYQNADAERTGWFRKHLQDVQTFLLDHWPENIQPASTKFKVAVHEPCSQRNVLHSCESTYALLGKIPGLHVQPLSNNTVCCGSAGSYMLSHPQYASQLRERKRQDIATANVNIVLSSNFGCSFYLNAQHLVNQPRIMHPLQLLADSL